MFPAEGGYGDANAEMGGGGAHGSGAQRRLRRHLALFGCGRGYEDFDARLGWLALRSVCRSMRGSWFSRFVAREMEASAWPRGSFAVALVSEIWWGG